MDKKTEGPERIAELRSKAERLRQDGLDDEACLWDKMADELEARTQEIIVPPKWVRVETKPGCYIKVNANAPPPDPADSFTMTESQKRAINEEMTILARLRWGQRAVQAADNAPGLTGGNGGPDRAGDDTKRRNRRPSANILALCKDAMKHWLDQDKSLTVASNLVGVDPNTVRRWIPNVLQMAEPEKQEEWSCKLKALKELP